MVGWKKWTLTSIVIVAVMLSGLPQAYGAATGRGVDTTGKVGLELDGKFVGWLRSAEGGQPYADVVNEPLGPDHVVRKHLAGLHYREITMTFGPSMEEALYAWMRAAIGKQIVRKNGAIIYADYNSQVKSRLEFTLALITEIGFPALDAASKDAAKFTLKITPEMTKTVDGAGKSATIPKALAAQKKWLPANYRLKIDGLETACLRVNTIEALTIVQKVTEKAIGGVRDTEIVPANLEIPDLVVTIEESAGQPFEDWVKQFIVLGNNDTAMEKNGTLEYLTPDLKTVLFTLTLKNIGIFDFAPLKAEANGDKILRVKASMYVEDLQFSYPGPMTTSTSSKGTTTAADTTGEKLKSDTRLALKLEQVRISPSDIALQTDETAQMKAEAVYSDKSVKDITEDADWKSGDTDVLTVDKGGLVTAVNLGTTQVSASFQGMTGQSSDISVDDTWDDSAVDDGSSA